MRNIKQNRPLLVDFNYYVSLQDQNEYDIRNQNQKLSGKLCFSMQKEFFFSKTSAGRTIGEII